MTPLVLIIAMVLEPIGPITDEPFIYGIDTLEVIDVIPVEVLEKKLRMEDLKLKFRIMELPDER
jgi:hypothetical protein